MLTLMGAMLTATMKAKAANDKALASAWGAIGLPTKRDQERLLHGINQLRRVESWIWKKLDPGVACFDDAHAPLQELKIAPRAVFDSLPTRRSRVRFLVPTSGGDWRAVTWGGFAAEIEWECAVPARVWSNT